MSTIAEQKKQVATVCRNFLSIPWTPISQMQRASSQFTHDAPARGGIWISRMTLTAPEDTGLRDALYQVCEQLHSPDQCFPPPSEVPLKDVGVEFIGCRAGVDSKATEPDIAEREKLKALEEECDNQMTILYIHGGGLYTGSPAEYRAASTRLARMTKARVVSTSYRLAPANPFPGPVLDTLVAYASLLYPPSGSYYRPVLPRNVVLAGNSAGANLCFALTRFLLQLQRNNQNAIKPDSKVLFNGREVPLPLPAGIATTSGWCDQCDALPSWRDGGENDILGILQPALLPGFPTDDLWPSKPPREHPYCVAATLDHELVSPAAVGDWTGAPPMWFGCGSEERGLDGNKAVASRAAQCGVPVLWNEYAGMPHEFAMLMGGIPQAKHCLKAWANACNAMVAGQVIRSQGKLMQMPACDEVDIGDVAELSTLPFNEIRRRMKSMNRARRVWKGNVSLKAVM